MQVQSEGVFQIFCYIFKLCQGLSILQQILPRLDDFHFNVLLNVFFVFVRRQLIYLSVLIVQKLLKFLKYLIYIQMFFPSYINLSFSLLLEAEW